ncbi:MAG: C25 family cysteine peptidase [Myxococcota bacterium]
MRVRFVLALIGLALLAPDGRASVGPVVGQAGAACEVDLCGDVISAEQALGGFTPLRTVDPTGPLMNEEYKPHVYFVEVPEDPANPGQPVPFVFSFFDLGAYGEYDTCFSNVGAAKSVTFDAEGSATGCDTATVVRIFPPADAYFDLNCYNPTNLSQPPAMAQFQFEATPTTGGPYFNCGDFDACPASTTNCCATLDGDVVEITWDVLFDFGSATPNHRLNPECLVPGTWQVEVDTSAASRFSTAFTDSARSLNMRASVTSVSQDDIDVYRFAAYQDPEYTARDANPGDPPVTNDLCTSPSTTTYLRAWAPFLNLTPPVEMLGPVGMRTGRTIDRTDQIATVDPVVFPDIDGGWVVNVDIHTAALDSAQQQFATFGEFDPYTLSDGVFPVAAFQPPNSSTTFTTTNAADFYIMNDLLRYEGIQASDSQGMRADIRALIPVSYLSPTNSTAVFDGVPGYPINVSNVSAQGLWRMNLDLRIDSPTDIEADTDFSAILTGANTTTGYPLNRMALFMIRESDTRLVGLPVETYPRFQDTQPLYFPITNSTLSPCGGPELSMVFPGVDGIDNIALDSNFDVANVTQYQANRPKPAVTQRVRLVPDIDPDTPGSREDNDLDDRPWACYEITLRLTNPADSAGPIPTTDDSNFGISFLVPGLSNQAPPFTDPDTGMAEVNDVRLLGISECANVTCEDGCTLDQGQNCTSTIDLVDCDNLAFTETGGSGDFINNQPEFDELPGAIDETRRFELAGQVLAGESAFVSYVVVASLRGQVAGGIGNPAYLTGLGEFGSTARWQNETTPAMSSTGPTGLPADPFDLLPEVQQTLRFETRFGPPAGGGSGESGGTGGTAPSTGDSGVDDSLATIASVRILSDDNREMLELLTDFEHNTAGFIAVDPDSEAPLTEFIPSRPDRVSGTYRIPLLSATDGPILIVEHELDGTRRRHGPLPVTVATVSTLPEPVNVGEGYGDGPRFEPAFVPRKSAELTDRARFAISESGVYALSYETIARSMRVSAAEAALRASEGRLRLASGDRTIPYRPLADRMVFFAETMVDEELEATSVLVSLGAGARVRALERSNPTQAPLSSFTERVLFEQDLRAAPATQSQENDVWMWEFLLAGSVESGRASFDFTTTDLAVGDAQIELRLRGGSQTVYKDHEVSVTVNGQEVHRVSFFGFDERVETFTVPDGVLQDGANVMTVEAIERPNVPFSVVWVDRFELSYPRAFGAQGGERVFSTDGGRVLLEGFDSADLEVWQLGNANHAFISNPVVTEDGGRFNVSFGSGSGEARYVAFTQAAARTVEELTPVGPGSGLGFGFNGAEYVVITHPSLREGAEELAAYRSKQGISTLVIDIFDIYDEFSNGLPRANALEDFVAATLDSWYVKPRYLVIVGDGSFDARNVLGAGDNLISPPLINSSNGRFASDLSLGEIGREPGLEIAVGRIPVQDPEELARYIEKVRVFESGLAPISTDAFIIADNDDDAGPFSESLTLAVEAFDRGAFSVDQVLIDPLDLDAARDRLFAAIESGTRYVNYIGHGSLGALSGEGILRRDDVARLGNSESPFVLLAASCLLGRFDVPGVRTLTETLLFTEGDGAAAVFASAGLSQNAESTALARLVAEALTERQQRRLGAIVARASALAALEGVQADTLAVHTILGDPALVVTPIAEEWQPLVDVPVAPGSGPRVEPSRPADMADADAAANPDPAVSAASEVGSDGFGTRPRSASGCAAASAGWFSLVGFALFLRRRRRLR